MCTKGISTVGSLHEFSKRKDNIQKKYFGRGSQQEKLQTTLMPGIGIQTMSEWWGVLRIHSSKIWESAKRKKCI